ncbi:MAG: hypothetical protein K0R09_3281 [Clostridiales bacterium]|jgi:hypothetical protein|nr:hypothetical protein [Clostridiales bacterium]
MKKRIIILLLGLIIPILLFCACGKSKEAISNVPEQEAPVTETPVVQEPEPQPEPKDTFVPIEVGIRPYAVMIDNEGYRVLPQGGLDKAQIIYEIIVEGGETRLMPVFWGVNPEMIGPVRSARHYFLDYALEHDAIYVHYGQSPQALSDIKTLKVTAINGMYIGKKAFWDITKDRNNWQDTYTSMEKLKAYAESVKYRATTEKGPVMEFNIVKTDLMSEEKVVEIELKYSTAYTSGFKYDEESSMYLRYRKGEPQMERVTGEQLKAENIIIQITKTSSIDGDAKGRLEVKTVGQGKGYYITQGKKVDIKWSKASRSKPTIYTLEDGTPLRLNPGQTWIQIMPIQGKVTFK